MAEPTDYDSIADRYVREIDERSWNALYERPATLALLPDVKGKHVLDAGCAHGWYTDWLLRNGASVVAVDISARMVELAGARLLRPGGHVVSSTHHPTHDPKSLLEPGCMVEELIEERW